MSTIKTFENKEELAKAAAETAVRFLSASVERYGTATWVLAGGSTPLAAYQVIATTHQDALDWSRVTFLLGDERIGPLDGPDNNWHAIDTILSQIPARRFRPTSDQPAEDAAKEYENIFMVTPKSESGLPRLDLVWLGVGSDGHTLSLFPNHTSLFPSSSLVIPVHDSPKPPRDRISFSLRALQGVQHAMVLASGADKRDAISGAQSGNNSPIALAISIIETHDGDVGWFLDTAAATD